MRNYSDRFAFYSYFEVIYRILRSQFLLKIYSLRHSLEKK